MLKFKMIDEVNVIIDDLIHILKREFFNNKSKLSKQQNQEEKIDNYLKKFQIYQNLQIEY